MAVSNKKVGDKFANIAYLTVTESAANTLTFATLNLANNLMDSKYAMIIHRAECFIYPTQMNGTGDIVSMALTVTDRLTGLGLIQPEVLFMRELLRTDMGAAASAIITTSPLIADFSELPGGGILVPADRLYIGAQGSGCAAANTVGMRLYYTVMPLDTADYWELIEARRIMTT